MSEYLLGCMSTPFIRRTAGVISFSKFAGKTPVIHIIPAVLLIYFNVHKICNTPKQTGSPLNHRLLAARGSQTLSLSRQRDIVLKSLRHTDAPRRLTDQKQRNKHAAEASPTLQRTLWDNHQILSVLGLEPTTFHSLSDRLSLPALPASTSLLHS